MRRVFGTRPRDLLGAIGPSIRACCYEVGEEVQEKFLSRFDQGERFFRKMPRPAPTIAERYPKAPALHLDLVAVARAQLESAGVAPAHIEVADFCTACRTDLFFSHRKEGSGTGRMMALIGIRPEKHASGS
jgi:copper oxidase (laccase) domain-containing protein